MSVYNEKPIGFCLFENWHGKSNIGSSRIRGHWLIKNWKEAEVFQQGGKYEAVIFQKVYWPHYVKVFKGIKILDVCDVDWLDVVPIKVVADNCDAVTTSTEALRDEIQKFTDTSVSYIPDRQDLEFHNVQKKHKGRAKKVIWFGYSQNVKVLDKAMGLLKKHNLRLTVLSCYRPPYAGADINLKYEWEDPNFDFNKIILDHDIVIMPSRSDPKGRFKSANKTYTSWALGMPVATMPDELERFLDPIERQKEADKRLKEVRENFDVRQSVKEFKQLIEQIRGGKR